MTVWITKADVPENYYTISSGYIANRDMAYFSSDLGVKPLKYNTNCIRNASKVSIEGIIENVLSPISPGDIVFVQFPTWLDYGIESLLIKKLIALSDVKVSLVLWDVIAWLFDDSDRDFTGDNEFQLMNQCQLVISPNEKMTDRLVKDGGIKTKIISMGLSDYYCEVPPSFKKQFKKELTFVGSLNKTDFSNYDGRFLINLIGNPNDLTEEERNKSNLNIMGELNNSDIPGQLNAGFGLVSYHNSNKRVEKSYFGGAERYGQFNNPFKLSLYLASGLPVIVDRYSPHAERIKKDGLGLVINELNDINEVVGSIDESQYNRMVENVWNYSLKLRSGFFSNNILRKAILYLSDGGD
ncbi:hypothetical protein HGT71_05760 [Rosenbergiella epipactidis]|uniref:hypothetical protein n=1 Tax=Rosenbergiella epipactidis TaxID=1544694 RepID=UPI001BDA085A|nr:hypothetical protein [Rosenbergiella epipactidis]MBT0717778.1 hypothetical protein [Rosenbergiella epipactidis]